LRLAGFTAIGTAVTGGIAGCAAKGDEGMVAGGAIKFSKETDALIVGMPEYNWSPTPLAKNALDWATRPPDNRAINDTVVAFLGSGGRGGTAKSQENLGIILGFMGATMVVEPPVQLSFVAEKIAADGSTDDPEITAAVQAKLDAVMVALRERDARHGCAARRVCR
jgi:NAD(P)H-dependent FMN reductase